jgi:hypothetical protein
MAQSAPRRVAASPRDELRAAVAERRRIADRGARLHQALIDARESSLDKLGLVDEAEERLVKAEAAQPHRAIAEVLGEALPPGPSVDEARLAVVEVKHQHDLAREQIRMLETGIRELEPRLTLASEAVRNALAAVVANEQAVQHLLEAYAVERLALALRLLGPGHGVSPGFQHPLRPLPRHDTALADAWRAALTALESGEVETVLPIPA